ncbi:MAG: nucleotidyltransferase domain-containing protein, partial [Thermoanaerobaculia bacterium]
MDLELLRREAPRRLREALGERYRGTILYGSRARGDASPESDIDLLVLVDDGDLSRDVEVIVHALYPLQLEIDAPIHSLPARWSSYLAGTYGLYRNARDEG